MDKLLISGPTRLAGRIRASGAKNAALPALAAALLAEEPLTLENVPRVQDVDTMVRLLAHLGVESESRGGALSLRRSSNAATEAPPELARTMRASALVLGPLVARHGVARVPLPGGCAIGARPIDLHLRGLLALGAEVRLADGAVEARARRLVGTRFRFPKPTVGGTENLMMAACLAQGTTVLDGCAREPEIVDLAELLNAMGAAIDGAGTGCITIEGRDGLGGGHHRILPDRIEAGTYLIGAALTGGDVTVEGAREDGLRPLLRKLSEMGALVEVSERCVRVAHDGGPLVARDVATAPHPGFHTDLQAQYMALATRARGTTTIVETVFENRLRHVPELRRLGAEIRVEGSSARVEGPTPLLGASVQATDLRASACLVLAGLAAVGETVMEGVAHLDRGYEDFEEKLRRLGASVERVRQDTTRKSPRRCVPRRPGSRPSLDGRQLGRAA